MAEHGGEQTVKYARPRSFPEPRHYSFEISWLCDRCRWRTVLASELQRTFVVGREGPMCRRIQCESCGKPTYAGCGRHVEDVLRAVAVEERCGCRSARNASVSAQIVRELSASYAKSA